MSASRAGCTFSAFGHDKKADQKSPLERLFKARNLCYSVDEANRVPNGHFTRPASAGANGRRNVLRMRASTSGGDTLPRKNCLHTCTEAEKFAL